MLLSINLAIVGIVIIVNVLISCCYHRKCYKLRGDDKPVSSDKVPITKDNPDSILAISSTTDDSTEISPNETECREVIITGNPISLEKSEPTKDNPDSKKVEKDK